MDLATSREYSVPTAMDIHSSQQLIELSPQIDHFLGNKESLVEYQKKKEFVLSYKITVK
jgi:hypothetical protein